MQTNEYSAIFRYLQNNDKNDKFNKLQIFITTFFASKKVYFYTMHIHEKALVRDRDALTLREETKRAHALLV